MQNQNKMTTQMNSFSCFKLKAWTFCSFFERMTENINSILGQVLRICKNFCLLPIIINIFFCLCRCSCIFFKKMFCHFAVTNNLIARTANLVIYLLHFASPFSTITIQRFSFKACQPNVRPQGLLLLYTRGL